MSNQKKSKEIIYRRANWDDVKGIRAFVDYWLAGRAKNAGVDNAGNDYFVTTKQHESYLKSSIVLLALEDNEIVGWGVKERNNVLIHLLVATSHRGKGIGKEMLKQLNPDIIRSKSDQQTGDPADFYESQGYMRYGIIKVGKKQNIDLMVKQTNERVKQEIKDREERQKKRSSNED